MSKLVLPAIRQTACWTVIFPAAVITIIGVLILIFSQKSIGYAFLVGVSAWLIPNLLFAYRLFSNVSPRAVNKIVRTLYFFEAVKLALTVILIITAIKIFPITLGYILLGYLLTLLMFWLQLLWKNFRYEM